MTAASFRAAVVGSLSGWEPAGVASGMRESREVMNLRQASHYLGVSPDTLYRYICTGLVPAFKLGSRWKFRKSVLDRWMEEKMRQSQGRRH